jgi:hypothetical protein
MPEAHVLADLVVHSKTRIHFAVTGFRVFGKTEDRDGDLGARSSQYPNGGYEE